jgi:hypothetical protein
MTKPRRLDEPCLCALSVLARVLAVLVLQSHHVPRSTYEHGEIAANLLAGRGFAIHFLGADGPTSQQAPVYPSLVALAYALGGVETPAALLILELGQCFLGGLLVLGVMGLAREVAPRHRSVPIVAGLLAAFHPTLVYAATHVQVALLGATLLTWTLLGAYRAGRGGRRRDAAVTGGLLGLLALTDPILALVAPGAVWILLRGNGGRVEFSARTIRPGLVMIAVAAAVVSPWVARNLVVHGEFVPIKSTFGYAFWQGNCSLSEGTDKVVRASVERVLRRSDGDESLSSWNRTLWAARHEAGYIDDIALSAEDRRQLGSVSEPERSRILFRRAIDDLRAQPGRYLGLTLRRLRYFWLFDETNPKTRVLAYRLSHLALTAMAFLGLIVAPRPVRSAIAPTVLTAALIGAFHALTIVSARFHVPIEPLMAVWAASGLARFVPGPGSGPAAHDVEGVGVILGLRRHRGIEGARGPAALQHEHAQHDAGDEGERADEPGAAPDHRDHGQRFGVR